jgi:glycosyltransferase involved in cell wall biosynthesis
LWQRLRTSTYRRANWVTSNSDAILEKMQRFSPRDRLRLLPNPILLPPVLNAEVSRDPEFVIVARLVHQKGIDILLEAFARIADQAPEWRLSLIGDGPLRDELAALAGALGIAERVAFHGHLASPLEHLRRSSVFVLPSRFEGMPNSLLEAMAAGLPPIVSDASPGPLEMVEDGRTGLVVPVEDTDALAAAMLRLAQDADYRTKLGKAAKDLVSKHDWAVVERTWREVLQLPPATYRPATPGAAQDAGQ